MKIKNEREEKYKKYVSNNTDPYGKAIIDAGEAFGSAVDEGKTFEEAEKIALDTEDGLTGYMVGAMYSALAHFHPRGEEIKDWWNEKFGKPKGEKGTVNPAIFTVKE